MCVNGVEVVEGVEGEVQESEREGKTVVLISIDGESLSRSLLCLVVHGDACVHYVFAGVLVGSLAIADTVKPEAAVAVHALQRMGQQVVLLTGDNRRTAQAIAAEVGIPPSQVYAEVLPSHKKNKISALQEGGKKVSY